MSDHATSTTDWGMSAPRKILLAGGVLVVLGLVIGGIVYGAAKNSGADSAEQGSLGAVAVTLDGHVTAMRAHGEQMAQAGQNAANQVWKDQGVVLITTARQLQGVADQLRSTDRDLALFPPNESVDIYRLRGDGEALIDAGRALVAHAGELETQADAMISATDVAGSAELRQTAEAMKADAATIRADGNVVINAGQPLLDEADTLERSLGH